jgi:HAD superfamily hydrolase (TIGR01549 family)
VSLTILLDLDDTLLENDIDSFLPRYLSSFSKEVAAIIEPQKFVSALLASTQEMVKNRCPDRTLKEVFDAAFFPAIDIDAQEFQRVADRFYDQVFPKLQTLTRPRPEAVHLVEQALGRGYKLAVATNPLFPRTAVLQRLAWANLPVEKYSFELITSYETFHFAKPAPAYFAEILGRLGWPDEPIVMVGDDLERDIIASRRLGIPAFWIRREDSESIQGGEAPSGAGELSEVLPWLDKTSVESLQLDFNSPEALKAILRATPAVLDSWCENLPVSAWRCQPEPGDWCITEILCHLRDGEQEVFLPRLQKVLQENNPSLPSANADAWAVERQYRLQDGLQAYQHFTESRLRLLDCIETIRPEDWQRQARHASLGSIRLVEMMKIIASHDRLHIQQMQKVLGALMNDDFKPQ